MEIELKPCPFCGGEATICEDGFVEYNVVCGHCFASIDYYPTRAKAIAAWNNRVGVAESATTTGERETVDISSRCIYGEAHVGVSKTDTTTKESSIVGSAAKMREWLMRLDALMQLPPHTQDKAEARNMIAAALSASRLNCEVGTAEEQSRRFDEFCFAHRTREHGCGDCPLVKNRCCELAWAKMPCEKGGANV